MNLRPFTDQDRAAAVMRTRFRGSSAHEESTRLRALILREDDIRAAQTTPVERRDIHQSALLVRAEAAGLIPDCSYHRSGCFTLAFHQAKATV